MRLSHNGELLATFSTLGHIKIWETDTFQLVQHLRDANEPDIDEYYCGAFLPDGRHLVAGGKLKDRKRWSVQDEDNHILPCPLKVRPEHEAALAAGAAAGPAPTTAAAPLGRCVADGASSSMTLSQARCWSGLWATKRRSCLWSWRGTAGRRTCCRPARTATSSSGTCRTTSAPSPP